MPNALLLIDVQKVYTLADSPLRVDGHEQAIANMNTLIDRAVMRGDFIICVRHVHKEDGSDAGHMFDYLGPEGDLSFVEGTEEVVIDPRLKIVPEAMHITKSRYSAFVGTGLDDTLNAKGMDRIRRHWLHDRLLLRDHARHGHDLDYYVDFILDTTGCPDASADIRQPLIKSVSAAVLLGGFARVLNTAEYIAG